MKNFKKSLSLLLILAMMLPTICSCSEGGGKESDTTDPTQSTPPSGDNTKDTESEAEAEPDRFAGVNYNGRAFRIYTSIDTTDATNADQFLRGSGEQTGEIVNDAVYNRNLNVCEKLGITLSFEEANYSMNQIQSILQNLVMSGTDTYDIIANDLRALAAISSMGYVHNIYNNEILDFDQNYWYTDAMKDLMLLPDGMYCLIGDYFTDAIASCHSLYVNESMLENKMGDGEYVNKKVFDGKWTFDEMNTVIASGFSDTDGNGTMAEGDTFGFTCIGTWGSMIPFLIGTGITFVDRSADGTISFNFNNERSVKILEKLNELFYAEGTLTSIADYSSAGLRKVFANGQTLIVGYNRLGDLANMRDIEFAMGVVPYPKLDEDQENYVTSLHDTTEIGAIPTTVPVGDLEFVLTCLEVFSRETAKMVIPEYYENALKVKYVAGADDAKMVDLIHDSIGSPFALAYDISLGKFMMDTCFSTPLGQRSTDFASAYKRNEKLSKKLLENLTKSFQDALNSASGEK